MWVIIAILVILWALGFISGYTLSGFLHLLLIIALIVFLVDLIRGRAP